MLAYIDPGSGEVIGASFRDPSGFVFTRDGVVHRRVNRSDAPHYNRLMSSGLYQKLTGKGLLVPHEDILPDYTREGFEAAFAEHWIIDEAIPIEASERALYRMHRRRAGDRGYECARE
jgi:hypothetical protein